MRSLQSITDRLRRIDGRGYRAYKELAGGYGCDDFELYIDHVQGDPFAAPSRLRVIVPHGVAQLPDDLRAPNRRVAVADFVTRAFARECGRIERRRGSGRSGLIHIDSPGQEVLERTACQLTPAGVELRFTVGLPAAGRRVLGRQAAELLLEDLPEIVESAALFQSHDEASLRHHAECVEDAEALRELVVEAKLVAFVANGALLPRRSGIDQHPLGAEDTIPFQSPPELLTHFELPNGGRVSGMGIRAGVTLIVGGGYHGKSTLLESLQLGIYAHRPGDGRELVVSHPATVQIRAEDGRRAEKVNISSFISDLPLGRDTERFSTEDASGSTSQAANLIEAVEAGAQVLLIDEDTAATNFMIRDWRMQQLVSKDREPITPFVDKVGQLYEQLGVSTIIVVGGSGDYFDVADRVIGMHDYRPHDLTARAKTIAAEPTGRVGEGGERFGDISPRIPLARSIDASKGRRDAKIGARDLSAIQFGRYDIDLSALSQLVDRSQLKAIGQALHYAKNTYMDGQRSVAEILDLVQADLFDRGLDAIDRKPMGDYAYFRRFELAAALNRLRSLVVR